MSMSPKPLQVHPCSQDHPPPEPHLMVLPCPVSVYRKELTEHGDSHVGLLLVLPRGVDEARVVALLRQLDALDAQLPRELRRLLDAAKAHKRYS